MSLRLLIVILLAHTWSCFGATFKVNSIPDGADVFVKKKIEDAPMKIGVAPVSTTLEEIKAKYNLGNTFFVEISKEGHQSSTIMLAPIANSDVELQVKLLVSKDITFTKKVDRIVIQLFEAQRLTRDKNYDGALKILDDVEKDEKYISVINEMRGGIYYLKKDFNSALSFYRQAFAINSENKDAYKMKLYLEKALGIQKE